MELENTKEAISPFDMTSIIAAAEKLLEYAPVAMLIIDLNGAVLHLNSAAEHLFGHSKSEMVGKKIEILVPDGLKHNHISIRENFVRSPTRREMGLGRHLSAWHKDGHLIPIEIGLNPLSVGPMLSAVIISVLNQSAVNRAERAELFVIELIHRAKNMFAIVSAIARQLSASNLDRAEFESAFHERLRSFASPYEMLALDNWQAPTIAEAVRVQLRFFQPKDGSNIIVSEPMLRLSIDHAEYLWLAIHELATNALKHVTLSVPQGKLEIHWSTDDTTKLFKFDWQEQGGPILAPFGRKGFDRVILEKVVPTTFDGRAVLLALPSGICWHLEATITVVKNLK